MNKFAKIFIVVALLLGGFIAYKAFFAKDDTPKYLTAKVSKGDLKNTVIANGEIQARELVDVGAQVGGQIKKLYVELGDKVKKGDMIAEIDSDKQENEIKNLEANLLINYADLNATQIQTQIAKSQYDRETKLYRANATSKEALENAKNSYALKVASLEQIKSKIKQNEIQLDTAKTNLGYTQIKAPLDGTVVAVPVKEGQTVNANQTTPTIVKIADLTKLEILMEITEADVTKIQKGMKVEYMILSDLEKIMKGEISSIDPASTSLSNSSSNSNSNSSSSTKSAVYYYAKILVDNADNYLKIGMTTENIIIINESKNTLMIPASAIKSQGKDKIVNVLVGKETIEKKVKLGISDNITTEIKEGLNEGDVVVISEIKNANKKTQMRGPRF